MRKNKPILILLFAVIVVASFSMNQSSDELFFVFYTLLVSSLTMLLRFLSLYSQTGNVAAWILLLLISLLPFIIVKGWKSNERSEGVISVLFGLVIFMSLLANTRFYFQVSFVELDHGIIINSAITSIYLCFIMLLSYMRLKQRIQMKPLDIFKNFILLLIYLSTAFSAMLLVTTLKQLLSSDYASILDFLFTNVRQFLMIYLQIKVYLLIPGYMDECFETKFKDNLQNLQSYTSHTFLFILIATIINSLLKLLTLSSANDVHFSLNAPLFELGICLFLQIFIALLTKSLSYKEENEKFI